MHEESDKFTIAGTGYYKSKGQDSVEAQMGVEIAPSGQVVDPVISVRVGVVRQTGIPFDFLENHIENCCHISIDDAKSLVQLIQNAIVVAENTKKIFDHE